MTPRVESRGGALALDELYAQHADFVWLTMQRLGVPRRDCEDLCHDAFLVAHQKLASYEDRAAVRSWLLAICARLAANYRRKARVRREQLVSALEAGEQGAVQESAWPEASAAQREELARARSILEAMRPSMRVVFVMFEIEGIPCDVIAAELGVPLGTVYSRLHAARKLFQSLARSKANG